MTDQSSSTAVKKSKRKCGGIVKLIRDVVKRPKSANSASQSNSTQVSVSSAFDAHDSAPGNDAGSADPMASSKYIDSILV